VTKEPVCIFTESGAVKSLPGICAVQVSNQVGSFQSGPAAITTESNQTIIVATSTEIFTETSGDISTTTTIEYTYTQEIREEPVATTTPAE
jgi:hypothetical protein